MSHPEARVGPNDSRRKGNDMRSRTQIKALTQGHRASGTLSEITLPVEQEVVGQGWHTQQLVTYHAGSLDPNCS